MAAPIISIVIPALNEAERISETIEMARESRDVEVIVADGGSTDDSPDLARRAGATSPCRADDGELRPEGEAVAHGTGAMDVILRVIQRASEPYSASLVSRRLGMTPSAKPSVRQ
jgi:glycosyltransferase involved in cell wall biosynthesis